MATLNHKRECRMLGCHNQPLSDGFCSDHGGIKRMRSEAGKERDKLYTSRAWQRFRHAKLSERPLCVACETDLGFTVSADAIDHIVPVRLLMAYGVNAIDHALCQPLCHSHHSSLKASNERRGKFLWWHEGKRHIINEADAEQWVRDHAGTSDIGFRMI